MAPGASLPRSLIGTDVPPPASSHTVSALLEREFDFGRLTDDDVTLLVAGLARERDRLDLALARALAEWDGRRGWSSGGSRSAAHRLAQLTNSTFGSATIDVARARRLPELHAVDDAVIDGRLSMAVFDLLRRAATPERLEAFREHQTALVEQCASLSYPDARTLVRYWCDHVDDALDDERRRSTPTSTPVDGAEGVGGADPQDGQEAELDMSSLESVPPPALDSRLFASSTIDDMVVIDGTLDAISGSIVMDELRRLADRLRADDRRRGVTRTPAQLRAAALVEMATRSATAPADGRRPSPLFTVYVGEQSFDRLCELANGSVLRVDQLLPYIDRAAIESVLFDGPSTVVSVSSQRSFRGALRRAIEVRDRRCQHRSAACTVRAPFCDVDHIVPHTRGGPTSQFNGRIECSPHNRCSELHDHDAEPLPERSVDRLDELRARVRWQNRHDDWFLESLEPPG